MTAYDNGYYYPPRYYSPSYSADYYYDYPSSYSGHHPLLHQIRDDYYGSTGINCDARLIGRIVPSGNCRMLGDARSIFLLAFV